MKCFSRFDPPSKGGILFIEPSMTQQHFADECDINNILRSCVKNNDFTPFLKSDEKLNYGDFSDDPVEVFESSVDFINSAYDRFDSLPAKLRSRFDNDPATLIAFLDDPRNKQEALDLGLIEKTSGAEELASSAQEVVASSQEDAKSVIGST